VEQVIPETRILGKDRMVTPHSPGVVRILRNMGYKVPSPIHYGYDWGGGTPFKAQKATAAMLVVEPRAFVLSTMGTGKTRSVLFAYDYLRSRKSVRRMLVVAPLSTLNFTWAREVFFNFPKYRVGVMHGSKEKRLKILNDPQYDILVVNHDGVKVMEAELMAADFDVICVDEVASFRNHRSQRHKSMVKVSNNRRYVWGLTGTPTPREPTDAFGIIRLITPGAKVARSFSRFRDELMLRLGQFKWVAREGAEKRVYGYMQPAVRFTMADCIDMPPVIHSSREVKVSPKQKAAYEALRKYCKAMSDKGTDILAVNEGVLLNKLLQVSSGCVYDVNKVPCFLDPGDRLKITLDCVMENEKKAIIFCPFVPLIGMVAEFLRKNGVVTYEVSGGTGRTAREKIFSDFQDYPERTINGVVQKEVIVAHPGTMAHGLTLTAASMVLWYAPTNDLEIYQQANARIARPGQTANKTQIIHLVGSPADKRVYRRLDGKQKVQGALLELFEE